jgi:molybdate transport system substrate-binding protein
MRAVLWIYFLGSILLSAGEIKIAVAANVSYAIKPLIQAFHQIHPTMKVEPILGSSGKLTAQIHHGSPVRLFMSADMKYPEALYKEGSAVTKPVVYAQGALALLSVKKQDFSKGLALLQQQSIKKIAIANPKTAPYGVAAAEALTHAKLYEILKPKFVYGESISQTVTYATKAADIGLIAKSSLFSPQMRHFKKGVNWSDVNSTFYTPISQGMVILKQGKDNAEVKAFYDFMLSDKAKEILKSYGYKI